MFIFGFLTIIPRFFSEGNITQDVYHCIKSLGKTLV